MKKVFLTLFTTLLTIVAFSVNDSVPSFYSGIEFSQSLKSKFLMADPPVENYQYWCYQRKRPGGSIDLFDSPDILKNLIDNYVIYKEDFDADYNGDSLENLNDLLYLGSNFFKATEINLDLIKYEQQYSSEFLISYTPGYFIPSGLDDFGNRYDTTYLSLGFMNKWVVPVIDLTYNSVMVKLITTDGQVWDYYFTRLNEYVVMPEETRAVVEPKRSFFSFFRRK